MYLGPHHDTLYRCAYDCVCVGQGSGGWVASWGEGTSRGYTRLSGSPYTAIRVMGGHVAVVWSPDRPSFIIHTRALSLVRAPWCGPWHIALAAMSLGCFVPAPRNHLPGSQPKQVSSPRSTPRKRTCGQGTQTFALAFTDWSAFLAAAIPHHRATRHTETHTASMTCAIPSAPVPPMP